MAITVTGRPANRRRSIASGAAGPSARAVAMRIVGGLDEAGPQRVPVVEGGDDRVLGAALDSRPAAAALLAAVGAAARDVAERQRRIDGGEGVRCGHGVVVGAAFVVLRAQTGGGNTEAPETSIRSAELLCDSAEVEEIGVQDLSRARHPRRRDDQWRRLPGQDGDHVRGRRRVRGLLARTSSPPAPEPAPGARDVWVPVA